jgi:hypothetical protein
MGLQAGRAFRAFRLALQELGTYYEELKARVSSQSLPEARRLIFPYRDHYTAGGGEHVKFNYVERLYPTKLVFTATSSKGDKLLIKFTRRYSEDAHRNCSDREIAPRLYAVENLPGGWVMVVMEFLGDEAYVPPNSSDVDTTVLKDNLKAAVDILHQGDFVHGDIRNFNMMVKVDWDTTKAARNVKLLDFDWAGPVGRTEYPPNVNHNGIKRPADAKDGNLITRDHDLEMLSYIFPVKTVSVGS